MSARNGAGVALLILAVLGGRLAFQVEVDNRLERWLDPEGLSAVRYEAFLETFVSDEYAIAAVTGPAPFSEASLDLQLEVLDALEAVPSVTRVSSLATVYRDVFGAEDPEALKEEFLSTPFYKNFLISSDGSVLGWLAESRPSDAPDARPATASAISRAFEPLRAAGWQVHLAGPVAMEAALDRASQDELKRLLPWTLALSILVLGVLLRSPMAVFASLVCGAVTLVLTFEIVCLTQRPLNMVTSVLPVLLWVLSLSNFVHIFVRFRAHAAQTTDRNAAMDAALRTAAWPCALSAFTTAAGFFSMTVASLAPVRELGAFTGMGLLISLAVNLTLAPLLLTRLPWTAGYSTPSTAPLLTWMVRQALARPRTLLLLAVVLAAPTAALVSQIRVESNPLLFFSREAPIAKAHRYVADHLTGVSTLEAVLHLSEDWLDGNHWEDIERLQGALASREDVARVLAPTDLLKKLNQWDHDFDPAFYVLPDSAADGRRLVEELNPADRSELDRLVSTDGRTLRLSVLVKTTDSTKSQSIEAEAEGLLSMLPEGMSGYVTGLIPRLVDAQLALVRTQLRTLGLSFLVVFVCILVGLRSWRLCLVSVVPNVLPICSVFAAMALGGVALDPGTVIVAGVALGIAVDDTVHLLTAYQRACSLGMAGREAVLHAVDEVGRGMFVTTVTVALGFAVLTQSAFIPVAYFGGLSALAMAVALLADIVLTPAMLVAGSKRLQP